MTITTSQLDELERKARELVAKMRVETNPLIGVGTVDLLQLVAIARAALAWNEAHDEVLGAAYMATSLSGGDFGPQRERYQQAIAALVTAIGAIP
jgi:hypothetical protein